VEIRNSDAAIIAASGGDPALFGEIFDRHSAAINRYLTRRLGASDGEDLTAETFVIAFRSRRRYDGSVEDARPWLFGIAANLLRRHWRTEQRRLRAYARTGVDPVADEIPDAERRLDAAAAGPQLARALASISADDREVLLLFAWADLSYEQIALALEIPAGTVRSRLSRARKQLREQLSPSGQLVDGGLTNPEGVGNG
jgi:RNA polymerase sigma-70 factor (ECF subfamily)